MQALTPFNLCSDTAGALFTHNTEWLRIMHPLSICKEYSGWDLKSVLALAKGWKPLSCTV